MKKTKAEKRLADLRRKMEIERTARSPIIDYRLPTTVVEPQTPDSNQRSTIIKKQPIMAQPQSQSIYIYPVQLIRRDLTKTLVLCILAISLELGLYLLLEKPGLLPF